MNEYNTSSGRSGYVKRQKIVKVYRFILNDLNEKPPDISKDINNNMQIIFTSKPPSLSVGVEGGISV